MTVPSFQKQFLSCKCGHEWTDHLPVNVDVNLWVAASKLLRCPKCGGGWKKILFGHKPKETPVQTGKSIAQRLAEWHAGADTGLSSICLAAVMGGVGMDHVRVSYPLDAADLGRCLRLLRLIPEWRPNIIKMESVGFVWAEMARRWADLEQTMSDEVGLFWEKGKSAPRTSALLHECEIAGLEADPSIIVRYRSDGTYCGYGPAK